MTQITHLLAMAVGLGSFGLYMVAFFFPEVYRTYDLTWSGIGTVYAIALWLGADAISPTLLIGQVAIITLLGRFVWQNLELRRAIAPDTEKTAFPDAGDSIAAVVRTKLSELIRYLAQRVSPSTDS